MEERMAEMTEEAIAQMRQRMQRQADRFRNQQIPIFRLMKRTNLKGVLVEPFNEYERVRYFRY